jgi:serine/threonine protein kinase
LVQSKSKGSVTIYRVPVNLELYIVFEKKIMEEGGMEVRVVGNYVLEKRIGSGPFPWCGAPGIFTTMIINLQSRKLVLGNSCRKLRDKLMLEIDILRQINHPNIIGLYDIVSHPHQFFLVMEYCSGGDLIAYIKSNGRLTEAVARHFMIQLAVGLNLDFNSEEASYTMDADLFNSKCIEFETFPSAWVLNLTLRPLEQHKTVCNWMLRPPIESLKDKDGYWHPKDLVVPVISPNCVDW